MKYIVTHPGGAHRDEFLAICIAMAFFKSLVPVMRREPTQEELSDEDCWVIDVGKIHDPDKNNFDHHQLFKDAAPICALSLVLHKLDLYTEAKEQWLWLEPTEILDSKGPIELSKWVTNWPTVNCDPKSIWSNGLLPVMSPVEEILIREFSKHKEGDVPFLVAGFIQLIGQSLLDQLVESKARMALLNKHAKIVPIKDVGTVIFVEGITGKDNPTFCLERWIKSEVLDDVGITITPDDRGNGFTLFRRNDHPRIDFNRIKDLEGVNFVHANGFVAKVDCSITQAVKFCEMAIL